LNKADQPVERSAKSMFIDIWADLIDVLKGMNRVERGLHVFWLFGPFILLIERSPADIWISTLAIVFVFRSLIRRDGEWLRAVWVWCCFIFLAVCLLSAASSSMSSYATSESLLWFRFPLFAMATVFWLGQDKRLLYAMLVSTALGMILMSGILVLELIVEGQKGGRLTWPYGDKVSGNYLCKVGLPAFTVMVALAIGAKPKLAAVMGVLSTISIAISVFTGERINFLIRACSGMLAALVWKPNFRRYFLLIALEILAVSSVFVIFPSNQTRYVDSFVESLPLNVESSYFKTMAAGPEAAKESPILGLGPASFRYICPKVIKTTSNFECDNHPHNFYIQLYSETGILGLLAGSVMIISIIWAAFVGWRKNRANVVAATAFVIPFGLFFPIQSTGDFFGQWNNIFMWSAIALALAAARTLTFERKK